MRSDVRKGDLFRDEEGFTTVGMAIALLVTLALIFSSAQVYRINSASAEIQEVADAAALAALNDVAEYAMAVRVCDALVLSMTLLGATTYGVGTVALCVPGGAQVSGKLLEFGKSVFDARDSFAQTAAKGLNAVQKALPFLAAASAASVAAANNANMGQSAYFAAAMLVPFEGEQIEIGALKETDQLEAAVDGNADDLSAAAEQANEAAQEALDAKKRAFEADCGNNPGKCMYERARSLAGLSDAKNPCYSSVDAWSFSVALKRAQAYYRARYAQEAPTSNSVSERANSALRKTFYAYAVEELDAGYVQESEGSFRASFPLLPKNTSEMRQTRLYTQVKYPVTSSEDGKTMHAWDGCPGAAGCVGYGSISQLDQGEYETCPYCEFTVSSMGSVAAASSSISNGFEYHYRIVAQAAEDYEAAQALAAPKISQAKQLAKGIIAECSEVLKAAKETRIETSPPGAQGCIALVVNTGSMATDAGFESSFVSGGSTLGARAAVAGATLIEDVSGEGATVLTSILNGFEEDAGAVVGAGRIVLKCWSGLLSAYGEGQTSLIEAVESGLSSIPLVSASGLGSWAGDWLSGVFEDTGLEPAELNVLKPVLINTAHVAQADDEAFSVNYLEVKGRALQFSSGSTDLFDALISGAEKGALDAIAGLGDSVTIAEVELPVFDKPIPVRLAIPESLTSSASSIVESCFAEVRSLVGSVVEGKAWQ